jgi:LacI family transcriptional regulator/LacI family repressor for deo operon, udp, cdd, tsx, nupC, and nupG
VEFLIGQGHTRVVHFAGPAYSTHSEERVNGVRRACSGSRVIFTDADIVPAGAHIEDGYRAGLEYFRGRSVSDRPTAVTCYNDLVALGLCRALAELGIQVPADISVVGFDDLELLNYLPLPLTTVRIPKAEMGRIAAQLLIRQIESKESLPPQKTYLAAELVVRQSTSPPAAPAAPAANPAKGAGGQMGKRRTHRSAVPANQGAR